MKALIVIDMQNDFINGSLGTKEAEDIVDNAALKIAEYHNNKDSVFFTRDTHTEDYLSTYEGKNLPIKHCIINTNGWKIHEKLETRNSIIVNKSTFGFTEWKDYLELMDEIEIIGLCTDICVISNALIIRALYPEKPIAIIENCTAGTTEENKRQALTIARCNQIMVKER